MFVAFLKQMAMDRPADVQTILDLKRAVALMQMTPATLVQALPLPLPNPDPNPKPNPNPNPNPNARAGAPSRDGRAAVAAVDAGQARLRGRARGAAGGRGGAAEEQVPDVVARDGAPG